ncbi:MAG: OmpA family protein [Flammeovirgaceae bacterium]|nr:OmpA family protein [Flammeovirgaceae bacterium]
MRFLIFLLSISLSTQAQLATDPFQLINSPYDEQNPVISPDGNTLFFTIGNHPQNVGGKKDAGDIWFSRKTGDVWSAPVHGGSLLNDRAYNAVAGVSADGNQLFIMNHFDNAEKTQALAPDGRVVLTSSATGNPAKTQGISVSINSGSSWGKPTNISIPYFQNRSQLISGHLSTDDEIFIYSAETYGTVGVEDLYVCLKKEDGSWSEPKNLGRVVNTQFQELCPWLSDDKMTLYFSTNGKQGFGSFDVYETTRLDDTWTNWSEPKNIGNDVNSNYRELYYFLLPGGQSLYTSTKDSDGYGDIKLFSPSLDQKQDTVLLQDPVVIKPVQKIINDNETKVTGLVRDAKTSEVINAKIVFTSAGYKREANPGSNGYAVVLNSTLEYNVNIEARGYVSAFEKLALNTYELRELEMNFQLQPIEIGTTVNLKNVLFVQSKTELLPESFPELDGVVEFMRTNPNVTIELTGHTDNRGVYDQLKKLSQARVDRVKNYLVGKGIDKKRIAGKGYGGTKPIASNDTEETRRLNRRVEFIIKKL